MSKKSVVLNHVSKLAGPIFSSIFSRQRCQGDGEEMSGNWLVLNMLSTFIQLDILSIELRVRFVIDIGKLIVEHYL
jgi:hypothetical protein